jgi:hypothetical protein
MAMLVLTIIEFHPQQERARERNDGNPALARTHPNAPANHPRGLCHTTIVSRSAARVMPV